MVNYEGIGGTHGNMNEEIYEFTIPRVQQIQETHQNFKFRLLDITQMQLEFWSAEENKFDWIYEMNLSWNPNSVIKRDWVTKIPEWAQLIESGKKVCVVHGTDKPRVIHENGRFYFVCIDAIDNVVTVKSMSGQQPYVDELFYWTPDLPEIMIKQSHIIRRYLLGNVTQLPLCSRTKSDVAYREVDGTKYWLTMAGLHHLIYPTWQQPLVSSYKVPSMIFGERDIWFRNKLQHEHPLKQTWLMGLEKWWGTLSHYWRNDPADMGKGVKSCWSKKYLLDKN
jgi:hypothetical protein